ncbi:hypothetical protein BV898_08691 [Hypsibius exemplaris]|uniref:Receptor ligand binding region domain-containing protein n=1 Tax=Hypsibius exemplaris TaxID=2072580 RepID=A0A1W0WPR2_HYPEX|nr:hypothetical protein BV898_08691 [Hypsibius exemplaris]
MAKRMISMYATICFLLNNASSSDVVHIEIACPGFTDLSTAISLGYHGAAFEAAVNESNAIYAGIFNFTLTFLVEPEKIRDGPALEPESVVWIAKWYYASLKTSPDSVRAIVTPGSIDNTNVQQLMANWNIMAIITSASSKSQYKLPSPLAIDLSFTSMESAAVTFMDTLQLYNWTTVFLVVDTNSLPVFASVGMEITKAVNNMNGDGKSKRRTILERRVSSRNSSLFREQLNTLLTEFRKSSRVMIFLARGDFLREMLLIANRFNMTNGEFVYLSFETTPVMNFPSNVTWQYGKEDDKILNASRREYGLDSLFNGYNLSRMFLNRTFPGDLSDIFIDSNGNRRVELVVSYFPDEKGSARMVYLQQVKENGFKLFALQNISSSWPNGMWPPPNEPKCGYADEKSACAKCAIFR